MNANVWSNIFFLSPYNEGSYIPTLETTVFENGNLLKILMRGEEKILIRCALKTIIWWYGLNGLGLVKLALGEWGKSLIREKNKGSN